MARRILLLITDLQRGGMPTVVRELAIRLARGTDAHIEVACLSVWGPVADDLRQADIAVTALGAAGAMDVRVIARLVRLIRRGGFDTVFSFLVHANCAAAAARLFCAEGRWLQCIQTTQPQPHWHWKAQAMAGHWADKIAVPSQSVAQVMRDWAHTPDDKLVLIPNAVEPDDFTASPVSEADPRPYPIGFIGRLDPVKRIGDLLEAVRLLNGLVHLDIFGAGRERDAIVAQMAELGDRVTLHGAIAHPREALSRIGMLVLPSDAEGFGIVLIEAMAAGVPVVATDVAGIRDVVRSGQTGLLVAARRPEALSQAIGRLVGDPGLRRRLIAAGRADVRERFTWPAVMESYRRLLEL